MTKRNAQRSLDETERQALIVEEDFLLSVQRAMQRILNAKGLRYRDLARRLGVSEARVSHMFGDEATNLTMRTVARVFDCLGEEAVLLSRKEYESHLAEARGAAPSSLSTWTVAAPTKDFRVDPSAEAVEEVSLPRDNARPATTRDWVLAEAAAERRGQAA